MPILPLDHPEPMSATLGVMLYPGEDDSEQRKAGAFAAHFLAKPIRMALEAGEALSYEDLAKIAMDGGERLDDLDERWRQGTATGEILTTLFAIWNTDRTLASWNNAIKLIEGSLAGTGDSGSRSSLWAARTRFLSVAHLWAAWCMRERQFLDQPENQYRAFDDLQSFLAEAEVLLQWGQEARPAHGKGAPFLSSDVAWRVPADWSPRKQFPKVPGWGKVHIHTISNEHLSDLKPPGRPRKPS